MRGRKLTVVLVIVLIAAAMVVFGVFAIQQAQIQTLSTLFEKGSSLQGSIGSTIVQWTRLAAEAKHQDVPKEERDQAQPCVDNNFFPQQGRTGIRKNPVQTLAQIWMGVRLLLWTHPKEHLDMTVCNSSHNSEAHISPVMAEG